jgi:hypothetical protein
MKHPYSNFLRLQRGKSKQDSWVSLDIRLDQLRDLALVALKNKQTFDMGKSLSQTLDEAEEEYKTGVL